MLIDSKKLEQFRVARGLSRAALARKIGLSKAQMYNIEITGRTSEGTTSKLANALSIPTDSLLPIVTEVIHNDQSPYGDHSLGIYTLALAKAKKAGLGEEELKELSEVMGRVVDILTIDDHQERHRHATIIFGMINLYHAAIFLQGGRERVRLSSSLKKDRAKSKT